MEEYIIILLILAFAILVGSTLGFGDALVFIPLVSLFLDVRIAVVIMGFWSTILSLLNSTNYRNYLDWSLVKKYAAPGIIGVLIGSYLIVVASTRWIEFALGVFVIIYVSIKIYEIFKEKQALENGIQIFKERNLESVPRYLFYSSAFSYGFLGGLIGASGPINVVLLECSGYERESFIANFSILSAIVGSVKLIVYSASGLFPFDYLIVFFIGFGVIFLVTKVGHQITPKIPKEKFQIIILILLIIIALKLLINSAFFY
ncbi:MAG: sulfite exporter TauE/SafE family protein [Promethearchaeia archaeon]